MCFVCKKKQAGGPAGASSPPPSPGNYSPPASPGFSSSVATGVKTGVGLMTGVLVGIVAVFAAVLMLFRAACAPSAAPLAATLTPAPVVVRAMPEDGPPVYSMSLDAFGKSYDDNSIRVDTLSVGKMVAIRSKVETISGDTTAGRLLLRGITTNAAMDCDFNERTTSAIANVAVGMVISVKGRYYGMESGTMTMKDCSILSLN